MKRILDRLTSHLDPRLVANVAVGAALALDLTGSCPGGPLLIGKADPLNNGR